MYVTLRPEDGTQLPETEEQIKLAMKRFDKSIGLLVQQNQQPAVNQMDEESLICLSLASRLRQFSPQKLNMLTQWHRKSVLRHKQHSGRCKKYTLEQFY